MTQLHDMDAEECRRLLSGGVVGRVAVSTPTGPHIVPVNYSVVDEAIVFRTTPYSVLGTHGRNAQLAFEVDHVDHANQRGWSVIARGRGEAVSDADELLHIRDVWAPRPWADGHRHLFMRLRWTELAGRRLGHGWTMADQQPFSRSVSTL